MRLTLPSIPSLCLGVALVLSVPGRLAAGADAPTATIDKITLLPVVLLADLKEGDRKKVTMVIEEQLPLELALKGYALRKTDVYSPLANYSAEDVAAMTEAELARLGPEDERYILLCIVNGVSSRYFVVANVGTAQMAAVLIDKQTAQVVWSNKIVKKSSLTWLSAGLIFIPMINQKAMATYEAFRELFKTLPER